MLSLLPIVSGLSLAPDGHDYTDYDRCGHDYSEQVLQDYRAGVRSGDDICDKGVYHHEGNHTDDY